MRSSTYKPLRSASQAARTMARTIYKVAGRPTSASRNTARWRHASTSACVERRSGRSFPATATRGAASVVRPDDRFPCAIACAPQRIAPWTATPAAVMPSRIDSSPRASCTDFRKPRGGPGPGSPSARRTLTLKHGSGRMFDPLWFAVRACLVGQEARRRRSATL